MTGFIDFCKNWIAEHLDDYEGQQVYLCDLGYEITNGPNMDGTLTYDRALAIDYLKEWWWEATDYFEYEKLNFGNHVNPFGNPEAYMVCMVIEGVNTLIGTAVAELGMDWNEHVVLTPSLIDRIRESVKNNMTQRLF